MKGAWHLVRLDHDRERAKRTNWLLIKAHDGLEHPGDNDAFLRDNDSSVASGGAWTTSRKARARVPRRS
ncbi:MAG: hypothetical protein WDM92_02795 [Caulobacteraceae bacterium]